MMKKRILSIMLIAVMLLCACRQNGTVLEIDTSKEISYDAGSELYGVLTQAQKDELAKLLVYDHQIEIPNPKELEPISGWWCDFEYCSDAGEAVSVMLMSSTLSIEGQKEPYYDGFYQKKQSTSVIIIKMQSLTFMLSPSSRHRKCLNS